MSLHLSAMSRPSGHSDAKQVFPSGTVVATMAIFPAVALVIFAAQAPGASRWQIFATGGAICLASAALGAILGFLFGIPKALTGASAPAPQSTRVQGTSSGGPISGNDFAARYGGNTNLEEISDWLTKILVGAGLVELSALVRGVGQLAGSLGTQLGGDPGSAALAISVAIYSAISGFLLCYVRTRLSLPSMLREAESLELAHKALDKSMASANESEAQDLTDADAFSQVQRWLNAPVPSNFGRADDPEATRKSLAQALGLASNQTLTQIASMLANQTAISGPSEPVVQLGQMVREAAAGRGDRTARIINAPMEPELGPAPPSPAETDLASEANPDTSGVSEDDKPTWQ
jgi:hypothetical protein